MNPFKGVSGARCKRKPNCTNVEIKQEPVFKEEPYTDCDIIVTSRPGVDAGYRANHEESSEFVYDFAEVKDEVKYEEETDKGKDSTPCRRLDESVVHHGINENESTDAIDVQPPRSISKRKERNGSSKKQKKPTIPKYQSAKNQKKHKCHVCDHLARDTYNLKIHLRTHTGEKPFQCNVCLKSFLLKVNLNRHKKMHGKYRCSKCKQGFEEELVKIDHERLCNQHQFECDICGFKTIFKTPLTIHMRTHTGDKPFECTICFKSFIQISHLRDHSKTHKHELPHSCLKCGQRFATAEAQQTHETRCKRSLLECKHCHYKTPQKHSLNEHMQCKHGAKKSYKCQICSKKFIHRIQLNRHLSTKHSDQFPFQCSKCFGGFKSEEEKIAHEISCRWRQYQCHLCREHCRGKEHLMVHMRKDHTGERFQCKLCAKTFATKRNSGRHMKTIHHSKI